MTHAAEPPRDSAQKSFASFLQKRSSSFSPYLIAFICASCVAGLGALMTDLGPWYHSLRRPSFQPPDWLFGPAWTTIFAMAAIAGALAWQARPPLRLWARITSLFAVNGVLNIAWSAIYFRLHRPDWALAETLALWLSVLALIFVLRQCTRTGALLMMPYLLWVSFAAVLNLAVVRLNYPFAGS
jgi:benzodiazapine receptor